MAGSGYESFVTRSVNWDLILLESEEEMVVRIALRRVCEENARQRQIRSSKNS